MTAKIAFVGLGAMGGGMVSRLLAAGANVTVYNRTRSRGEALAGEGAVLATTPAAAARGADVVFLSLATSEVVEQLLFGENGVVEGLPAGAIVADMSTVAPEFAVGLQARLAETGHRGLDACVLGNAQHAKDGELRFMIGGAAQDVAALAPVIEPLAKEVTHLGPGGKGATAKLALNLLMGVQMQALVEAIAFGERAGLDRQTLIKLIAAGGYSSPMMKFKAGVMARRAFEQPDFRLKLMRKDLGLVLAETQALGVPMPTTAASHDWLTAAQNRGLGEHDVAALLAFMESVAGLDHYPWPGEAA
ncbi:NAD(P)-dependent oxidoreductase [Actinophytocola gossypii]|uniref:NAD(P)-dependent oxidoreductase n=1 Tax=Actinophytocola gossypii TaxID=2812003 RepID=A0ABT2JEV7_9PSEU|nr:NAD(P)-dependent oxidoreductase [Actinophytocola gossypii]MCT2585804.1 NAD(P)-dependent oxidoreductase [Actinophytocola gossypii]